MKNLKKAIALLLCLSMIVGIFAVSASAQDTGKKFESDAEYPIIFVTGIGQSYSYLYANESDAQADIDANETDRAIARWNLFCNDFSFLWKEPSTYFSILSLVGGLFASIFTGKNCISRKTVDKFLKSLFRYNIVDENGELPPVVVTPRCYYPVSQYTEEQRDNFYRTIPCSDVIEGVGEDMLYCFNYSAFSFTFNNSDSLDDFIDNYVLPQTGCSKVVLIPMSMGASVVSAYLHDYGTKGKVDKVVSIVGAWNGSDIIADLVELKYSDKAPDKLYNGIVADLVGEPWGYLVNMILRIFPKATLRSIIDEILDSLVENLVMKAPSLFGIIPSDRYPAIRAARLEGKPEKEYIMKQTDRYYEVQKSLKDSVMNLYNNYGVDFYYLCGYGLAFGEFSSDYEFFGFLASADTTNSDEIIEISSTATGATYVTAGTSFDSSYLSNHDAKYISPDKSVDLSTCFFPDRVWLFDKQKHELENNNTALKLAFDIALGNVTSAQDCVDTYPQFNDSRDLKRLKRSYIPDLDNWLAENTPTAEQQRLIDENTAAVNEMMGKTINNREQDDKVIENYRKMLVTLGIYEEEEEKEDGLTSFFKALNDFNVRVFGFKGFIDIFKR
jgi:pimeloyl-ACP methyl ester carboxylesterase